MSPPSSLRSVGRSPPASLAKVGRMSIIAGHGVGFGAGGNRAGPPSDGRHAHPAFPSAAFVAA